MKKVYIVDDDVDLVESMKINLESDGFDVSYQYDDKNLTDNIRACNPSLIILDVMFPGDSGAGFRMARTIRHHDDIRNIPILMLSAVNTEGEYVGKFSNKDIDEVYLPITEFIEKPIDPKKLIEKANGLMKK